MLQPTEFNGVHYNMTSGWIDTQNNAYQYQGRWVVGIGVCLHGSGVAHAGRLHALHACSTAAPPTHAHVQANLVARFSIPALDNPSPLPVCVFASTRRSYAVQLRGVHQDA